MKHKSNDWENEFVRMGKAALLPGVRYLRDKLLAFAESEVNKLVSGYDAEPPAKRKYAKREIAVDAEPEDSRAAKSAKAMGSYWGSMTYEERSAEMARRMNKRNATVIAAGVPEVTPEKNGKWSRHPHLLQGGYTTSGAAAVLGIHPQSVGVLLKKSKVPHRQERVDSTTKNRVRVYDKASIDALVEKRAAK